MTYRHFLGHPLAPTTLRGDLDRIFTDVFGPHATVAAGATAATDAAAPASDGALRPATTLVEDADGWTVTADLPGVAASDVEVLAEDRLLTVRGTRTAPSLPEGATALLTERRGTHFERRLRLPKAADTTAITAEMADGVLTVRIGKVAPARPRRITVSAPAAD